MVSSTLPESGIALGAALAAAPGAGSVPAHACAPAATTERFKTRQREATSGLMQYSLGVVSRLGRGCGWTATRADYVFPAPMTSVFLAPAALPVACCGPKRADKQRNPRTFLFWPTRLARADKQGIFVAAH